MTRIALNRISNAEALVQQITERCEFFAAQNKPVIAIFLSSNDFNEMPITDIQRIFAAIPESVRFLSLAHNALGCLSGEVLAQVFAAIPASIKELDLFNNCLGARNNDELVLAFAAIPANITRLGLAKNNLLLTTGLDQGRVFSAIPATVKSIKVWHDPKAYKEDVYTMGHYARLLNLLPGLIGRKVQYLDQSTIVHRGIFKHLPFYFHPETKELMYGSAFNLAQTQHKYPLLFRTWRPSVQHELPLNVVANIYEYLTYAEICKLALAKTAKDGMRCVLM